MKNFYRLMACAAVLFLTASCSNDDEDRPSLAVSPATETITFSSDATESYTFTVETNQPTWNVETNQSWCTATKTADNKGFVVTATPNTVAAEPEAAIITVTAGNATPVNITAKQAAVNTYNVTIATSEHGTVDSNPEDLTSLIEGTEVSLTAKPADGFVFSGWEIVSDAEITADATQNPLTFTMPPANISVTPVFEEPPYLTITTTWGSDGGSMNFFFAGDGEAVIDWGDGSELQTVKLKGLNDEGMTYTDNAVGHRFIAGVGEKNIRISGNITGVGTGMTGTATAIDASHMPTLEYLDCRLENISSLNLSGCSKLKILHGYGNNLSSIDVSQCTAMTRLFISGNHLTSLDISHNPDLEMIACDKNDLSRDALLVIFKALPDRAGKGLLEGELYCGGYDRPNPGYEKLTDADRKICSDKNWWPYNGWF